MPNTLWHCSKFRSTRALWMWKELELLYPGELPELAVQKLDEDTLRNNKPAALLQLNRLGKVPTFVSDDGAVILFESAAICNYFCRRFDKKHLLLPQDNDVNGLARHDVITHFVCGTADNVLATSSPIQRVLTDPTPGNHKDIVSINEIAWHELVAPTLEDFIHSRSNNDIFTASDVIFGFTIAGCKRKFPSWLESHPILQSFYDDIISNRPAFLAAMNY